MKLFKDNSDIVIAVIIAVLILLAVFGCLFIITGPESISSEKNWSEPLANEWFKSMEMQPKGLNCVEYNSRYAKCSAAINKEIITFECYKEEKHCNVLAKNN